MTYDNLTAVDLFCGCGGLSEGFRQAGFEILLGIDNDEWAIKTYNRHNDNRGLLANIQKIYADDILKAVEYREIDALIGGPPCQAFSTVATAKWNSIGNPSNINHKLNKLYKEFLRLVYEIRPKFFVIENVERMLSINKGIVKNVIESTVGGKYRIDFYTEDVVNFGVPQHRRRVLVIGNNIGVENPKLKESRMKAYVSVRDAIGDLPITDPNGGSEYMKYGKKTVSKYAKDRRIGSFGVHNHTSRSHNKRDLKIFAMLRPGQSTRNLPKSVNPYRKDIFTDKYKKQPWDGPSSTVMAHLSKDGLRYAHPDGNQNRSITPREAARLQSFDDKYIFEGYRTHQYIQIGNAVPPLFARAVALSIKKIILRPVPCIATSRNRKYH